MTSYARAGRDWTYTAPEEPVARLIDLGVDTPAYRATIADYESVCVGCGDIVDGMVRDEVAHRAKMAELQAYHDRFMRRATASWLAASWTLGILAASVVALWWAVR